MDLQKKNNTPTAVELRKYFEAVFAWVQKTFPHFRTYMKGLAWGIFYNKYSEKTFNAAALEKDIERLLKDKEVTSKRGIYEYLLSGEEKHLSLRKFPQKIKRVVYERQNHKCAHCGNEFELKQMEADHITPWSEGGKTELNNCQMLCKACNRRKGNR